MKAATQHRMQLGGRRIDYRVVPSKGARKLRVRVGPNGVEVVQPTSRNGDDVSAFLDRNQAWILSQVERVERLRSVRRPARRRTGEILYRGEPTLVRVEVTKTRGRGNLVSVIDGDIVVRRGISSRTPIGQSLETWLRRQARGEIERQLATITPRLRHRPGRLYVMGQRTKWGNCSAQGNLSFNWRLILAPPFVLGYLVTHEAVHLAVPDHSAKFWLTVRSFCPEAERAKHWLRSNSTRLWEPLAS